MFKRMLLGLLKLLASNKHVQENVVQEDAALASDDAKASTASESYKKLDDNKLIGALTMTLGALTGVVAPNAANLVVDEIKRRNPVTGLDNHFIASSNIDKLFKALGGIILMRSEKQLAGIPEAVSESFIKQICESKESKVPARIVELFRTYNVRTNVPEGPTIIRQVIENVGSSKQLDALMELFDKSYSEKGTPDYINNLSYIKACVSRFSDEKKLSETNKLIFGDNFFDFTKTVSVADTMDQAAAVRSVANAIIVASGIKSAHSSGKEKVDIEAIHSLENVPEDIKVKLVAMAEHLTEGKAFEDIAAQDFYAQAKVNLSVDALASYNSVDFRSSGTRVFPHIQSEQELMNIAKDRLGNSNGFTGKDCFGYSPEGNVATYITSPEAKLKLLRYAAGLEKETQFYAPNEYSQKVFSYMVLGKVEDTEVLRQLKQEIERDTKSSHRIEKAEILRSLSVVIEDRSMSR